ncbi:Ig-like domain-containing protein [Salinibacterium sp. G-O1]|uniref:Ig-like domain-containing protein n=1 Tax=Salinibacterium sp. G-O1 TaxID=3046208 RepID=UPI0024BAC509|nr:tandem-95 repeat protein [Salinibacterium sp. G-O1]MDJ0334700.1 Ig-like domain-containing protein [Salinibacterium sp. G-O1]
MLRKWLSAHTSSVVSLTSGVVIAALIATVAIVSTGYSAQRLDLGDGSVWVANSQQQAIGRANPEVLELNTVVSTTGNDVDVLQRGETVFLFDRSEIKIDIVDPATSQVTDSVPLPPDQPEVFLAGDNVVIFAEGTGELWVVSVENFTTFDAESESTLSLGKGAAVSVDPDGLLFAYSPVTSLVYRVDAAGSAAVESSERVDLAVADAAVSITSVSGHWAILDLDADQLYMAERTVDLAGLVATSSSVSVQWASSGGDRILVGYSGGLISVPLSGAAAVNLADGQSGIAARPLALDGCEFASWTNGNSWRRCLDDGGSDSIIALASVTANAQLSFVTNGDSAVLNDRRTGRTWAVQRAGELINNWDDLITTDEQQPQEQQNDDSVPPEVEKVQEPPVAIDDEFGARPGRATVLPVLLNDYDPNGDVLVVSDLAPIDESIGRIDLINERQQIQLTLTDGATGQVSFSYTITDGRGGSASAMVVVAVRSPGENSPPAQVRSTKTSVVSSGRVTTQVLADWVDPDGDAFYLTDATVAAPAAVTYKPNGTVIYSDAGSGAELAIVTLVVSDGAAEGTGTLSVAVKPNGDVPIVADPFVVLVSAGQETTIAPLDHVHGGSGILRLNSVPAKPDATLTPSYETGTFRFTSSQVRSHYLEYVVTDGTLTVTGIVRVDVVSPPDPSTKPITVPKTVFVRTLRNERIDVAGTDVDPAGGVLLVTGLMNIASNSGVRAEILDQRVVRVSLDKPLDNGPVSFNYRISNGLAEAEGVITVIEIPALTRIQPPIANDDSITVRVGEAIDIPVLANDEHPDGLTLTLQPVLDQALPEGSGLLFASDRVLRYLAPNKTGNFSAAYRVTGPDGQAATGLVRISVREPDTATNNAPVPTTVTARVLAGETVRVRIPLSGIDPDGDSVQLIGQSTNPEKGSVSSVEDDTFVYEAGTYSAGTDSFTYTVIDSLGARATGLVRIGISPRLEGARNPVAIVDEVTVRPGVTVSVQALVNDSDPDGSPLKITSAIPNDDVTTAVIAGTDVVDITPPIAPGNYGVIYTIENDKGGTSQNFIRVTVDPNAPLSYPIAADSVLTLSDVLNRPKVTVDVLANVFFADGESRSLGLSVYPGYSANATVTSSKRIEVTIANKSQIIPFKLTHPDDSTVFSYAFIRVPGLDDTLPQLDRRAPALKVNSESELIIDINDYVIAVGGKTVRLTDSSTVRATHSNGRSLVADQYTLRFTSADRYFGPASISFEVTDGTTASDPNGRTSILVLPITVEPRANQAPAFGGAVIDFEPGQERDIDLLKLTNYPYPDDIDELVYSILAPQPEGFRATLTGTILTLQAGANVRKGAVSSISLGVRDGINQGDSGRIQLTIVPSTRPLLIPAADSAIARRGSTTSVDVLLNDAATNPFPGSPLRVINIRGLDGGSLPAGVVISPNADNTKLTVTVAQSALPGDVNLQYQVADSTNDPDRYVWGSIAVSVQDRPDPVANIAPTGFADKSITLRWNAGASNNSPTTSYRVTASQGSTVVSTTECSGTTCAIPTLGNGPTNGVTVSVVATNAIGDSDAAALAGTVWSDLIPPAPTLFSSVALDHGLNISWNAVASPAGGSPVDRYQLTVGAYTGDFAPSAICSGGTCTVNTLAAGWTLDNGVAVTYTVSPRNAALTALSVWNTSEPRSDVPAGPPIAVATPLATVTGDASVRLDWPGVFAENGRSISSFRAAAYTGAAPTCAPDGTVSTNGAVVINAGTATSAQFSGLQANATYTLLVFAFNGQGCTASSSVIAHTAPGIVTSVNTGTGPVPNGDVFDYRLLGGSSGAEQLTSDYSIIYRLIGSGVPATEYGPVALGSFLVAGTQHYGHNVAVQVRACRTWDSVPLCQSNWSASFNLGTPVDPRVTGQLTFVSDDVLVSNSGTFQWDGLPVGYSLVAYACGAPPTEFTPAGTETTCHADAGLLQVPQLTIRVTANGTTYTKTYDGPDYD